MTREWSPKKRPEMGAAKKKEQPVAFNLVEEKEWKDEWNSDEWNERVQSNADDYYRAKIEDQGDCEGLIEEILGEEFSSHASHTPRDWSPRMRPIGPEGITLACKGLKDRELEAVEYMIRDTAQYMYEDAMLPDDEDINFAIEETKDKLVD